MNTVVLGTDLVEVGRIAVLLKKHPTRFVERCFTDEERAEVESAHAERHAERYAARFAAKEATLKALGTGLRRGIAWQDIAIATDRLGAPSLVVRNTAAKVAYERDIDSWLVSLSHTENYASATVIGLARLSVMDRDTLHQTQ